MGDRDVVAVSNCSDGLIAALSLVAEPGGEVIIPGYTYLATWQAVGWAGMIPVVADVDDRGLLDPAAVEAALSSRTGAILAVHLAGSLAPMAQLRAIADRFGLALVADWCACPRRQRSGSISAGSLGDIEAFSLGATKQVAAGEGGCLTVRDPTLVEAARRWALQGHEPGSMDAVGSGMNLRLSELAAALALRQLELLGPTSWSGASGSTNGMSRHWPTCPSASAARRRVSGPPTRTSWSGWTTQRIVALSGAAWRERPSAPGPITTSRLPDLTAFSGRGRIGRSQSQLAARSFAISIHARLTDEEVDRVANAVRGYRLAP